MLCNACDNTRTVLTSLEMSVTDFYMLISTHSHKDNPLKPPNQDHVHYAALNMWKDDIFIFLQKGPKHLRKTHAMGLNVCNDNM